MGLLLAPFTGDFVTKIECTPQFWLDGEPGGQLSQEADWRFVFYVIEQDRSQFMRLDDVAVAPRSERALDLDILKHFGWLIQSVFGHPTDREQAEYLHFYDRA